MPNQKLLLSQKQGLKISPRQIQFLHFLQLNELELEERIQKELEENPVLDLDETEDYEHETIYERSDNNFSITQRGSFFETNQQTGTQIREELKEQFRFLSPSKRERQIGNFILDSVDEKGYLKNGPDELEDILSFGLHSLISKEEIVEVLGKIRRLEPSGVASESLQNFLIDQANNLVLDPLIIDLLENHFDLLSERNFDSLSQVLEISKSRLKTCLQEISNLKPYPFYGVELPDDNRNETIIPEYMVNVKEGKLVYGTITRMGKKLVFNQNYGREFNLNKDKKLKRFLAEKRESAQWFMQAIEEREETKGACISAVIKLQEAYFLSGDVADLKPMILKDVAMLTGKTISTLSRVTSQKYVQTHFGLISMKVLFSEAIQRTNGELSSNKEVQEIVSKLVSDENKRSPLTDAEICEKLAQDGLTLTRRTITKYRENMNIPSSKLRRAL